MAHGVYIRPSGVWNSLSDLLASEMAAFDAAQFESIRGDTGGVWAPSSIIEIGGSGVRLAGLNHEIPSGGKLTVKSGGTLQVDASGSVVMAGTLAMSGIMTIPTGGTLLVDPGASITFNSDATFNGNVIIGNAAGDTHTIQGTMTMTSGSFVIDAAAIIFDCKTLATFRSSVAIGDAPADAHLVIGTMTFFDPIILSGDARVRRRTVRITSDSNQTITPLTADFYTINAGILTATRDWTIDDTGCADGDSMLLQSYEGTQTVNVKAPGGGILMNLVNTGGNNQCTMVIRVGGTWQALRLS